MATLAVGEIQARLTLETAAFARGIQEALGSLEKLKSQAEAMGAQIDKAMQGAGGAGQNLNKMTDAARGATTATNEFATVMGKLTNVAEQFGIPMGTITRGLGELQQGMTLAATSSGLLGGALAGVGVALAAVATGGILAAQGLVKTYDEMRSLSAVTGQTIEDTAALADAFEAVGIESGTVTRAVLMLTREIDTGGEHLRKFGINLQALSGLAPGDQLIKVMDHISGIGDAATRNSALMEIFTSRIGRQLVLAAQEGEGGLSGLMERFGSFSKLTADMAAKAHELMLAQRAMSMAFGGVSDIIGAAFAPAMAQAARGTAEWLKEVQNFLRTSEMLPSIVGAMVDTFRAVSGAVSTVAEAIGDLGGMLGIQGTTWKEFRDLIQQVGDLIRIAGDAVAVTIKFVIAEVMRMAGAVVTVQHILRDALAFKIPDTAAAFAAGAAVSEAAVARYEASVGKLKGSIDVFGFSIQSAALASKNAMPEMISGVDAFMAAWDKAAVATGKPIVDISGLKAAALAMQEAVVAAQALETQLKAIQGVEAVSISLSLKFDTSPEAQTAALMHHIEALQAQGRLLQETWDAQKQAIEANRAAAVGAAKGSQEAIANANAQAVVELMKGGATFTAAMAQITSGIIGKVGEMVAPGIKALGEFGAAMGKIAAAAVPTDQLGDLLAIMGQITPATQQADLALEAFADGLEIHPAVEALNKAVTQWLASVNQMKGGAQQVGDEMLELKRIWDLTVAGMNATIEDVTKITPATQANLDYANSFKVIAAEAELFGSSFDAAGAKISLMSSRISQLLKENGGVITDEIRRMNAELSKLKIDQKFEADVRAVFGSVKTTFNSVVQGLIQGTLDIEDAFKNLGQSLLAGFSSALFDRIFTPILDSAANFVSKFINTFVEGIGNFDWGSIFSTVVNWISKIFGGGGGASALGGDWWDDIGLEALAHGGRVTTTGPFVLHAGETVVPGGFGGGTSTPLDFSLTTGSRTIPVDVQNFNDMPTRVPTVSLRDVPGLDFDFGDIAARYQAQAGGGGIGGSGVGLGDILGGAKAGYNITAKLTDLPTTGDLMKQGFNTVVDTVRGWFAGPTSGLAPTGAGGAWGAGQSMGLPGAEAAQAYGAAFETGGAVAPSGLGMTGTVAAGVGTLLSLIGGMTGTPALGYAGMGIQGTVLATQIASALFPSFGAAVASGLASVGSAIGTGVASMAPWLASAGSSIGSFVTGIGATLAPTAATVGATAGTAGASVGIGASMGALGTALAPGAIAFGPAILASILVPMFQKNEEKNYAMNRQNMAFTGDLLKDLQSVTMQDLTNNADLRQNLGYLAGSVFGTDYSGLPALASDYARDKEYFVQQLIAQNADMGLPDTQASIAMYDHSVEVLTKLAEQMQALGIQAVKDREHLASFGDPTYAGQQGFNFLEALSNMLTQITTGATAAGQEISDSNREVASTTSAVVRNQADLIIKYGATVQRLGQIGDVFDVDLGIPDLMKLTAAELEFLGTATGAQIEGMIEGWRSTLTNAVTAAVMADPVKLVQLLPLDRFAREGESTAQTANRLIASLTSLGKTMRTLDQEILGLVTGGLDAATVAFVYTMSDIETGLQSATAQFVQSAFRIDEAGKLIGDPTAMAESVTAVHDLMVARYEAEMALIAQITEAIGSLYAGANALVGTASRLQELGILPSGGMEMAGLLTQFGTAGVGKFATAEQNVVAGSGAVQLFAQQSMMAARAMDPAAIQTSLISAGNLVSGFIATIDQINQIQDPSERMRLLTEVLGQAGSAAEAAANAAITYWQTVHDTVSGMMDQLNGMASNIAGAGNAIASNADWLMKAGVDIQAIGVNMLGLIELFPTMAAKLDLLGSGVRTFVAGISETDMARLANLGAGVAGAPGGAAYTQGLVNQITDAFAPVLMGFKDTFIAAMQLQDPGQRLAALTGLLENIGAFLGSLPPDLANALIKIFGPEIQILIGAIETTGREQAAAAAAVAAELKSIIGNKALSPENFLLLTVQGIQDALDLIVKGAEPVFRMIAEAMTEAGGDINAAINTAGAALSAALGGFKTPAEQLANELMLLRTNIQNSMYLAVVQGIKDALAGTGQAGIDYVPKKGIYLLHPGEIVANPQESAGIRSGEGYYGAQGYQTYDVARATTETGSGAMTANVSVTVNVAGHATREDAEYIAQVIQRELRSGTGRVMVERIQKGTL